MRTLITGIAGFVGSYLTPALAESRPADEIWGTAQAPADAGIAASRLLIGDLTDAAFVEAMVAAARPDRVSHLAGFASGAGTDRERIFRVNVEATRTLLEALASAGRPCRVHLASSGYVYGATTPGRPAREDAPPNPSGAYAESKAAMEAMARDFAATAPNLEIVATRSFNHTGPRQTTDFVVPAFAAQIARIEAGRDAPVVSVGNLEAGRDFLDVRDVVRAYVRLLETPGERFRVVNVARGAPVTIQSLLDRLIALSATPVTVRADPARLRPSDIPESVGDASLLARLTGWQPEISLDRTLRDTLDYWRAQYASGAEGV
jgi:GDP-4-dehydro-6-deoxy-D-mannose reductase